MSASVYVVTISGSSGRSRAVRFTFFFAFALLLLLFVAIRRFYQIPSKLRVGFAPLRTLPSVDLKKSRESMLQRLRRLLRQRHPPEVVIRHEPTEDDQRRAEELVEKHGWDHLPDKK